MVTAEQIKVWGRECGFDVVGICDARPVGEREALGLREYLAAGRQGEMGYLERNVEKRLDVGKLVEGARSVVCCGLNYFQVDGEFDKSKRWGKVTRYAWGRDYHDIVREQLKRLAGMIQEAVGCERGYRCFVDTAPLLEKYHASRAGLGWIGKNGLLLNERFGSWMVLGEVVLDFEVTYDGPVDELCGDCELCLGACPTGALIGPHKLDARRCLSYQTVESGVIMDGDYSPGWIFGCDACQDVCPYNKGVPAVNESIVKLQERIDLDELVGMDEEAFKMRFKGTSLERGKLDHLNNMARFLG